MVAQVKSFDVLEAALRDPGLQSVKKLRAAEDRLEWLSDHLEAEFEGESEILVVSMRGNEDSSADLLAIVDAVSDSFLDMVVMQERNERRKKRDVLASNYARLKEKLRAKLNEYHRIKSELAPEELDSSTELIVRKAELDTFQSLAHELAVKVECWDIELQAATRLEMVTLPYIEDED